MRRTAQPDVRAGVAPGAVHVAATLAVLIALTLFAAAPAAAQTPPPTCGPPSLPDSPGCQLPGGQSPGPGGTLERSISVNITTPALAPYPDCATQQFPCVLSRYDAVITSVSVSASDRFGNTGGGNPFLATFIENSPCAGQTTCSGKARYAAGLEYLLVQVNYQYGRVAQSPDPFRPPQTLIGTDRYLIPLSGAPPTPGPPRIEAITLSEPSVRTGVFQTLGRLGTTDGNRVRITARVRNPRPTPIAAVLEFKDPLTRLTMAGGKHTVTLPAGGAVDLNTLLSTTGFAWSNNTPVESVDIRATLVAAGESSEKTVPLAVRPKPLVLVHGLNATATTYRAYMGDGSYTLGAHPGWRSFVVGDGQFPGIMRTKPLDRLSLSVRENALEVERYVNGVRAQTNAAHVDMVAHSLGGLISRQYVHERMPMSADGGPAVSHLVLMGVPNTGSPCGDLLLAGLAKINAISAPAEDLTGFSSVAFNRDVVNRKGTQFSALVGNSHFATCGKPGIGDLYVEVAAARWILDDHEILKIPHTSMTSSPRAFEFIKKRVALARQFVQFRTSQAARKRSKRRAPHRTRAAAATCANAGRKPVQIQASTLKRIPAGGRAKISIPVSKARSVSVLLVAPFSVSAVLRDPSAKVRARSAADPVQDGGSLRTLTAKRPRSGTWRLELVQTAARAEPVAAITQLVGGSQRLRAGAKRSKRGALVVTAKATRGNRAARGLRVSALIGAARTKGRKLRLRDTGRRGDRKARDGVYTGSLRRSPSKAIVISAQAKGKGFSASSVTWFCGS